MLRPSGEVSGESQVTHPGWHARRLCVCVCVCVCVCGQWGWVGTCFNSPFWRKGEFVKSSGHTDTILCICEGAHLSTCTHTCHPHARKNTPRHRQPVRPPTLLPLTLPHTHKIRLNYPRVLSPTCLLVHLFLQREHFIFFFSLRSYSISLFSGFRTSTTAAGFLIFFHLFSFLLGCFT